MANPTCESIPVLHCLSLCVLQELEALKLERKNLLQQEANHREAAKDQDNTISKLTASVELVCHVAHLKICATAAA